MNEPNEPEYTYKELHGTCEDAPCCGCCGGDNDYMTDDDFIEGGYDDQF